MVVVVGHWLAQISALIEIPLVSLSICSRKSDAVVRVVQSAPVYPQTNSCQSTSGMFTLGILHIRYRMLAGSLAILGLASAFVAYRTSVGSSQWLLMSWPCAHL